MTGVKLSATEAKLRVGQTKVLIATVIPADAYDKDYTWSSDDPSIAEVAGGIVVAKKRARQISELPQRTATAWRSAR